MSDPHILYSFRRCPYAMRARMGLKIAGIEYEHREVLLRDKPAEMLTASPKATVPIMVLEGGEVIDESFDIMLWALEQSDPEQWLAPDMAPMLDLIKTIEGPFAQEQFRYKYASFFDDSLKRGDVNVEHRDKACVFLKDYEEILAKSNFLMGEKPSLADYAIFPFIRQFAAVERDWWDKPQFPHLHKWWAQFMEDETFTAIMEKYPLFVSSVPVEKSLSS